METNSLNIPIQNLGQGLVKYVHSLNLDNEERVLVQDTILNAISRKQVEKKDEYLNSWADAMHKKAFINNYRRILMQKPVTNTDNLYYVYKTDSDSTDNQDAIFDIIIKKIENLDRKLFKPFKMYVEGFSYNEIAEEIKLKPETVKNRIFQAKCQLIIQE